MNRLELHFGSSEGSLNRVYFASRFSKEAIISLRGSNVPGGHAAFKWTPVLHSLSLALITAAIQSREISEREPLLKGHTGTPAVCLSNVLYKANRLLWVYDMFGVDDNGTPILKKLFVATNPRKRRDEPTGIYLNQNVLARKDIHIFLDGFALNNLTSLTALKNRLTQSWAAGQKVSSIASWAKGPELPEVTLGAA